MGVSYRQAKRLWRVFKRGGAKALRHRQVGRASNRGTSTTTRQRVLRLIRQKYSGDVATRFGPTLVAEHLASEDGLTVDHETLRRWMLAAGLWSRQRKRTPYRQRRERKAHFGELVQLDGSFHRWYEARGARRCLITMVDDATSRSDGRFSDEETIWAAAAVLRAVDRAVWRAARALHRLEECVCARGDGGGAGRGAWCPRTQFGRMCAALADSDHSGQLAASQRPRRAESRHAPGSAGEETAAAGDRRRRAGECLSRDAPTGRSTMRAFRRPRPRPRTFIAAVPSATTLDRVFRLEETRTVGQDWVVRYHNRALQLARQSGYAPARSTVTVCEWPDGRLAIEYRGRPMQWTEVTGQRGRASAAARGRAARGRAPSSERRAVIIRGDKATKASAPDVPIWQVADR